MKKGIEHIGVITKGITGIGSAFGFKLNRLLSLKKQWPKIAGSVVAANIDILTIRDNGVLILSASSSVWMHEVNCLRFQLLSKFKNAFPDFGINNIIVKMADSSNNKDQKLSDVTEDIPAHQLTASEKEHIENCVKDVEDEGLQDLLRRIFIKSSDRHD